MKLLSARNLSFGLQETLFELLAKMLYIIYLGSVLIWSRLGRCADTLEDAAAELQSVITVVEATSQPMSRRDPMRPYMDIIYKYAQDKSPFKPSMVPRVTSATVLH